MPDMSPLRRVLDRFRRPDIEFAEPDALTRAIQRAMDELIEDGAITPELDRAPEVRYDGFCARSVQAYWRFTRDPEFRSLADYVEVEPWRYGSGSKAHYWIRVKGSGRVLDLNLGPADEPDRRYPYHRGRPRRSFQPAEKGSNVPLRKDAHLIMERVRRNELDGLR
jgi:hypothetical protein